MSKKISFAISFLVILTFSVFAQNGIIRKEYLKITPYVSTLEDVATVYGNGHNVIKGGEDYLRMTYTISEKIEVNIDYFRDCNETDKPEKERTWVVNEVFFSFEKDLKLRPRDIFLDKKDFTACPYGDVGGQIIYFNNEKDIEFTYLSLDKAVTDLSIKVTQKNKERYKCKKDKVIFSLDPKGFRCNSDG